jgi:cellobiose phosphorylase
MYRLLVEAVLGLRLEVVDGQPSLLVDPRIPPHWSGFEVDYVHGATLFRLQFDRSGHDKAPRVTLDGRALGTDRLPLVDDGLQHAVQVALPSMTPVPSGESSELLL